MKRFLFFWLIVLLGVKVSGQERVQYCKKFKVSKDTITLDSRTCNPSLLPLDKVIFVPPNRVVVRGGVQEDSILLCYQVLLKGRYKTVFQTHSELDNRNNPIINPQLFADTLKASKQEQSQLFTNGSLSRGLVSGSNQSFLINSDLNLQLQGNLGKGVRLTAAVADNNSPLQPDGTTLKIQDFDRVFIRIDKDSWSAVAGDYFMQSASENHFLAFNKKSRGLQFQGIFGNSESTRWVNETDAAISRGRFARNEIQGQEGLQGPYRLRGTQNEAFIIIIAATESIFVDGKKLERGQQNDYVINYNTAEIIFNPNVLITQYSRIVAEFQYADQNYSRVLFNQHLAVERSKIKVYANYFIEQDNKNQPFQAENELSLFDSVQGIDAKRVLAQAGDDNSQAVLSTIRGVDGFSSNQILYQKKDTSGFIGVLEFVPNPTTGIYFTATFSNVGDGKGNYIQVNTAANGRVYAWVDPINGEPQGSFEPIIQLVAPKRQQMATLGFSYQPFKQTNIKAELAYSQFNSNTFSNLDKQNDDAMGSLIAIEDIRKVKKSKLVNTFDWERVSNNFSFIERYRNVEFERKWNRGLVNPELARREKEENIITYLSTLTDSLNEYKLGLDVYNRKDEFSGINPNWSLRKQVSKRIFIETLGDYLNSALLDSLQDAAYDTRTKVNINLTPNHKIILYGNLVENNSALVQNDSSLGNSFQYQDYGLQSVNSFNKRWTWNGTVGMRTDWRMANNSFIWASDGLNIQNSLTRKKGRSRLALISSLRFLSQNKQFFTNQKEQFLQQRLEYANNNYNKGYRINFYLQSGTGREQKREFVFIEVPAGQGQYAWNDYNRNEIKEINEFELSVFKDQARFIKVYNLTNEFVNANLHEGNLNLKLVPAKWIKNLKSKWISNVSNQLNVRVQQQNNSNNLLLLNPFEADTQILSGNTLLRNSIIYNSLKFGQEFTYKFSEVKSLLTYGSEANSKGGFLMKTRYNLKQNWQFDLKLENDDRKLINAFFDNRNYDWTSNSALLSVSWQNIKSRIGIENGIELGSGQEFGVPNISLRNIKLALKYFSNLNDQSNIDLSISRNQISYNGNTNSPLGFQVLSGQTAGINYLWNLNLRTLISKNIQIGLGYEGRSIPSLPIVHIGRAEARYLF